MDHDKKSIIVTLIICRIAAAAWFICIPLVPFIARWYDVYSNKESIFTQFVSSVYAAMIPAGIIVYLLNRLLSNLILLFRNCSSVCGYDRVAAACCYRSACVCFYGTAAACA